MKIENLSARKILASTGNETVEVLMQALGREVRVSVPAGISAGKYEVKNVTADQAVQEIETIKDKLIGADWNQASLDNELRLLNLGGNTSLALSAAFWKFTGKIADGSKIKFPELLLLLFEGAKHGNPGIIFQEFLLVENSLQQAIVDFKKMHGFLEENQIENTVGAEGGFSPQSFNNQMCLDTIKAVFPEKNIAIDAAGSFKEGEVDYEKLLPDYSIMSLEDPFSDEEWAKWTEFTAKYGQRMLVVGDDLTTTNPVRLQKAIETKAINAVIIKPNQNGTISGTLETVALAKKSGLKIIVSHRGEETDDDWIVDFALAVEADYVKFGGMDRGERVAKYNRLLELGMK